MNPRTHFLEEFFQALSENNITYCVLKNYEDLPEKPGRDVDLWVKEDHFSKCLKVMFAVATSLGWDFLAPSLRLGVVKAGEYYFIKNQDPYQVCVLDLSPHLGWKGTNYLDEKALAKHIRTRSDGLKIASPGIEAAALIFRGAMMGEIKDKDKPRIQQCLADDPQGFEEVLREPLGRQNAKVIWEAARAGKWGFIERHMPLFRRTVLKRALLRKPLGQLRQWVRYFSGRLKSHLRPSHGFFIVFLGPDGAGKTTIAKGLLEAQIIKDVFPRRVYLYRRFTISWLKKIVQAIKNDGKSTFDTEIRDDDSPVPLGTCKAAIYSIYLGFEYLLGYYALQRIRSNAGVVAFDRYFYDYLVFEDFGRCPRWLLMAIIRIIPRPDALVYLQNDPKTIYARKPERSVDEIERQAKICERLVAQLPNSFIVNTSHNIEHIKEDIVKIVMEKLQIRNKSFGGNFV